MCPILLRTPDKQDPLATCPEPTTIINNGSLGQDNLPKALSLNLLSWPCRYDDARISQLFLQFLI